jgi:hypothetical protein
VIREAVVASLARPTALVSVCDKLRIPRSTVYAQRASEVSIPLQKRGPKPLVPDENLLAAICEVLTDPPFMGEDYRKVHARLRYRGILADVERIRLLMREHGLQAPGKPRRIHAALEATRYEAIVPLHQACRASFGGVGKTIATGLKLRHDNGSQFISRAYQAELRFLGMDSSPSFVRAPEGNGCIERFWRTLKEQLLWIHSFANIEDLNQALQEFRDLYNHQWLIERHNHRPPAQVRQDLLGTGAAA